MLGEVQKVIFSSGKSDQNVLDMYKTIWTGLKYLWTFRRSRHSSIEGRATTWQEVLFGNISCKKMSKWISICLLWCCLWHVKPTGFHEACFHPEKVILVDKNNSFVEYIWKLIYRKSGKKMHLNSTYFYV